MTEANQGRVEDWLRRVKWALHRLPAAERDDILAETRAHLHERIDGGQSADAALNVMGSPEAYARRFLDEMELTGALASLRSGDLLKVVLRRVNRSLVALAAFFMLLVIGVTGIAFAATALGEMIAPEHFGMWIGPGQFNFGYALHPEELQDLLGKWIYPVCGVGVGVCWLLFRAVLLWAARRLRGRPTLDL